MGYRVELYIYDLSQGMARQLVPMLGLGSMGLNFEIDGIWHTAIVVHNTEWFFGGGGIEHCRPGGTMMGRPLKVEYLGDTDLDLEAFRDYLYQLGQDQFRGDRYDLFQHNCNNFSNTVSQFLCNGKTIPEYILELPQKVLSSPIAQLIRPFIEQATPHGESMANDRNGFDDQRPLAAATSSATTKSSSSSSKNITDQFVTFTTELNSERVVGKLRELNAERADHKMSNEDLAKIGFIIDRVAMLDVKVWNEVVKPALLSWPIKDVFPLLDVVRWACARQQLPAVVLADTWKIIRDRQMLGTAATDEIPEPVVRLTLRIIANFFAFENSRSFILERAEECINLIQSMLVAMPSGRDHIEIASAAVTHNFGVTLEKSPNQDIAFLLVSTLASVAIEKVKNFEASVRIIQTLTQLISSDAEVRDLAQALDLKLTLENLPKLDSNVGTAAKKCLNLLA